MIVTMVMIVVVMMVMIMGMVVVMMVMVPVGFDIIRAGGQALEQGLTLFTAAIAHGALSANYFCIGSNTRGLPR